LCTTMRSMTESTRTMSRSSVVGSGIVGLRDRLFGRADARGEGGTVPDA
jgi:hypothetical protein